MDLIAIIIFSKTEFTIDDLQNVNIVGAVDYWFSEHT
jgi:hypothetical protein